MPRVQDVLRFRDKGTSVEDARLAMLKAGEAPRGIAGESKKNTATGFTPPVVVPVVAKAAPTAAVADVLEPTLEEDATPTSETAAPAVEAATPMTPIPAPAMLPERPKVERTETDEFITELRQEGGKWVAEIQYKNGAGTERFTAPTKSELMTKLLEGKGHATLRVKQAVRREKLGGPKLDRSYPLPEGFTTEDFSALPEKQQGLVIETIAAQQAQLFCSQHQEFYQSEKNSEQIQEFLKKHDLPYTLRNLEYALEDLTEDGLLELRPGPERVAAPPVVVPVSTQPIPATRVEDSAPATPSPAPASPVPVAVETPAAPVRKRGTSGLTPELSSVPSGSAGSGTGETPRELSEAELRKLPMDQLKRIATADRRSRSTVQR